MPNWLIVNTDIRKLEKLRKGKVREISEIQSVTTKFDSGFDVMQERDEQSELSSKHVNPVVKLWEQKEIKFPEKGIVPNSISASSTRPPSSPVNF